MYFRCLFFDFELWHTKNPWVIDVICCMLMSWSLSSYISKSSSSLLLFNLLTHSCFSYLRCSISSRHLRHATSCYHLCNNSSIIRSLSCASVSPRPSHRTTREAEVRSHHFTGINWTWTNHKITHRHTWMYVMSIQQTKSDKLPISMMASY